MNTSRRRDISPAREERRERKSMAHNSLFRDRFPPLRLPPGIIRPLPLFCLPKFPFFFPLSRTIVFELGSMEATRWEKERNRKRTRAARNTIVPCDLECSQRPSFDETQSLVGGLDHLPSWRPGSELSLSPGKSPALVRTIVIAHSVGCRFVPTRTAEFTRELGLKERSGWRGEDAEM